jgi:tripartite-type tricarboxylate transporter receptor subunit TctC
MSCQAFLEPPRPTSSFDAAGVQAQTEWMRPARSLPFAALAGVLLGVSLNAMAAFPEHPIHVVVPTAPGAAGDLVMRRMADRVSQSLGQPVVVDNLPGAGGVLAANAVKKARPDGYTVFFAPMNSLCINPFLMANLPYDPPRDFAAVTSAVQSSVVLAVAPHVPASSLAEFIAYAKSRPEPLTIGSPGEGSVEHLATVLLEQVTGLTFVHAQYKSAPQALVDVAAGHVDAAMEYSSLVAPMANSGKLRALVIAGKHRKPALALVPTGGEAGFPALDLPSWSGFVVPAGTPPDVVAALHAALAGALREPAMVDWLAGFGAEVITSSPTEFATFMDAQRENCRKLVSRLGMVPPRPAVPER